MKTIILVSSSFGDLDIVVKENPNQPNTFKIGNKRIDFSEILPENVDLRDESDYRIIIWDGIKACVKIIVDHTIYTGTINIRSGAHEELSAC